MERENSRKLRLLEAIQERASGFGGDSQGHDESRGGVTSHELVTGLFASGLKLVCHVTF